VRFRRVTVQYWTLEAATTPPRGRSGNLANKAMCDKPGTFKVLLDCLRKINVRIAEVRLQFAEDCQKFLRLMVRHLNVRS